MGKRKGAAAPAAEDGSESESSSSSEEEEVPAMELDARMEEEGMEDIDFEFDDPQERHFEAIRGLLKGNPFAAACGGDGALNAVAELLAGDPKSVGTVVATGVADDLVGVVAGVQLAEYAAAAGGGGGGGDAASRASGVDALKRSFNSADLALTGRGLAVAHGFFVNAPPKVVAAAFECFVKDLASLSFDHVFVLAKPAVPPGDGAAPASKKTKKKKKGGKPSCATFYDDEFAKVADATADLGPTAALLRLSPAAFRSAVKAIRALADA